MWTRQACFGYATEGYVDQCATLELAIKEFKKKFKAFTGLSWHNRSGEPREDKFVFAEKCQFILPADNTGTGTSSFLAILWNSLLTSPLYINVVIPQSDNQSDNLFPNLVWHFLSHPNEAKTSDTQKTLFTLSSKVRKRVIFPHVIPLGLPSRWNDRAGSILVQGTIDNVLSTIYRFYQSKKIRCDLWFSGKETEPWKEENLLIADDDKWWLGDGLLTNGIMYNGQKAWLSNTGSDCMY